jgi:hypothetical protein
VTVLYKGQSQNEGIKSLARWVAEPRVIAWQLLLACCHTSTRLLWSLTSVLTYFTFISWRTSLVSSLTLLYTSSHTPTLLPYLTIEWWTGEVKCWLVNDIIRDYVKIECVTFLSLYYIDYIISSIFSSILYYVLYPISFTLVCLILYLWSLT